MIKRISMAGNCLAILSMLLVFCVDGHADTTPSSDSFSDAELQQRIVQALARGGGVAPLIAELEILRSQNTSHNRVVPQLPRSNAAAQLQQALEGFRPALTRARAKGASPDTLDELLSAYESMRVTDALVRARFAAATERLASAGAASTIHARQGEAETAYTRLSDSILGPLQEPLVALQQAMAPETVANAEWAPETLLPILDGVARALDTVKTPPQPPILRAELPYRRANLASRTPVAAPTVQPAYLIGAAPVAADLTAGSQTPLSKAILRKAEELGYDPVRIFEFVRNEIDTEWYDGSMKGARVTLAQGRGNHSDQASLLIALLRASQFPTRYVRGVVELSIEQLAADLALVDPTAVPDALARAGVAFNPIIRGGRVAAVQVEYTWVTAQVPYANYRGAVVDFSGKVWIPLAPASKRYQNTPATGVLRQLGFSVQDHIDSYLAAPQSTEPLVQIRATVEDYLTKSDGRYDEQLGSRSLQAERLQLLPSSLPFAVVAVTGESPQLAAVDQHRVRFVVRSRGDAASPALLDVTVSLSELADQRVTLSYLPAAVEDHKTVNAFGGLDNTPVYLIQLRPQLKIAGKPKAVAEIPLAMGTAHRLELELIAPSGRETVTQTLLAGSYYALAFGAPGVGATVSEDPLSEADIESDPADTERLAARLLSQLALNYSQRWDTAEEELAGLLNVSVVRPLPSVVIVGNAVKIEHALGLPHDLKWQGVTLDATLRIAEPLARDGDASVERDWLRLSALQGSALEQLIFEDRFLVDGISADKGLGLAKQQGIQVVRLDGDNVASVLPTLNLSHAVKTELAAAVHRGYVVEAPRTTLTRNAWQGAVWRIEDPTSGAAGYFITGGLAGGATTKAPGSWVLDFLANALQAPYSSVPNLDSTAVAVLEKLPSSDGQVVAVGDVAPVPLAVRARDAAGRPVAGAIVQFVVTLGGGKLNKSTAKLAVKTDFTGIAKVAFQSGEHTGANPVYIRRDPGDEYRTQALVNEIEARVSAAGVALNAPFTILAYPGEPAALRRTDAPDDSGSAATWADTAYMSVEDGFGNPLSNVPVTFSAGSVTFRCEPPPNHQAAVVFDNSLDSDGNFQHCAVRNPVLGDCGSSSLTLKSSIRGASVGFILGNSNNAVYTFDISAPGVASQRYTMNSTGVCNAGPSVRYATAKIINEFGANINAAKVGEAFARPVPVTLLYSRPDFEVEEDDSGEYYLRYLPTRSWHRTTADVAFTVDNDGSVTAARYRGSGTGAYETTVTAGLTPGRNQVSFTAANVEVIVDQVDPDTGDVSSTTIRPSINGDLTYITGLNPQLVSVDPSLITLNVANASTTPIVLDYILEPKDYIASFLEVDLFEDRTWRTSVPGSSRSGSGTARFPRQLEFDIAARYEVELVVNRGSAAEIRSDPLRLPLTLPVFHSVAEQASRDSSRHIVNQPMFSGDGWGATLSQEVDLLNNRICSFGGKLDFNLTQQAHVTATFQRIQGGLVGGPTLGQEAVLIDSELHEAGEHELTITPSDLSPGTYRVEFKGVAVRDGKEEVVQGTLRYELRTRDSLPVGHTLVKGVNLWNGNLTVSREDFRLPGREQDMEFRRSYSSNVETGGPLGVGWTHNYDSHITITPCGEVIVVGGQGGGMRFVDDGQGGLRPLKGYHGSLIANPEDNSFDFYAKDGTRFHYGSPRNKRWLLEAIEDPNGNRTELAYESGREPKLVTVTDAGGRVLAFHYERRQFPLWSGDIITQIEGPDGIGMSFAYDKWGNLVRATRENDSRLEEYGYPDMDDPDSDYGFYDRHLLVSVTNTLRGSVTRYSYDRGPMTLHFTGLSNEAKIPRVFTAAVTEPEGGTTRFEYQPRGIAHDELVRRVIDRRDQVTRYTLNRYGSPVKIEDSLGHSTLMQWASDDVVMIQRTDANGVVTDFDYDQYGNLLRETVRRVTDFGGTARDYVTTHTYWPPKNFEPPYIKNRLKTTTNRNGAVTEFEYDRKGNLIWEAVQGTDFGITHSYADNGDRLRSTDPNGHGTGFTYDVHGNLDTTTDPLGGMTATEWNERSLPARRRDALGRVTTYEYDTLNRRIRTIYPAVDGEVAKEIVAYDDATGTTTETDAEGRDTVTETDREGRITRVQNPLGDSKVFEYDPEGYKILESDWFGSDTPRQDIHFEYDAAGRLITRTEPFGRVTRYRYDPVGNLVEEVLEGTVAPELPGFVPRMARYTYDGLNRRIGETRLLGTGADVTPVTTDTQYDGESNVVLIRDPLGRITRQVYDPLNRLVERIDALGHRIVYEYDANGNLILERRDNTFRDQIRRQEYDELNRVIKRIDAEGNATVLEYDAVGNLLREIDPRINVVSHSYDVRNRRIRTVVGLDRVSGLDEAVTTFNYDRVGNLGLIQQPNGNIVAHVYDGLNRVVETSDELGSLATYHYDANGNVLTETDANGNMTERNYDALHRLIEERRPENRTISYAYDPADNRLLEIDGEGNAAHYEYDTLNRRVAETDALGQRTVYGYDLVGNRISVTDRRGHIATFDYDDLNRLIRSTAPAPLSYVQTFTYDEVGNQIRAVDRRGIVTETHYDRENRPIQITQAGLVIEVREYDENGNLRFQTDANGNKTGYEYDERDLVISENRPLAAITRTTRDIMGDAVAIRDPEGRVTQQGYDLRRRMVTRTNGAGETTFYDYDDGGNRTLIRRPEGNETRFVYDAADHLVAVRDPLGNVTEYGYDLADNRISHTDANDQITEFVYDELNRLVAKIHPDATREDYEYDAEGNRIQIIDAKGQAITDEYDEFNRLIRTDYSTPTPAVPGGDVLQRIEWNYDENNNLLAVTEIYAGASGTRTTTYLYDDFDRVEQVIDPDGKVLRYGYDANGNRVLLIDPDGRATHYAYDGLNRLSSVTISGAGVTEYDHLRNSLIQRISYPNGTVAEYHYDLANRLTRIENSQNGTAAISRFDYEYDHNGNRVLQVETQGGTSETTSYSNDLADRLIGVMYPDQTVEYTYDPVGNRTTEQVWDGGNVRIADKRYYYDSRNRLEAITDSEDLSQDIRYGYDANGNQITRTQNGQTTSFYYDSRHRLVEVQPPSQPVSRYRYDYQGLRTRKESPTETLRYVYDDQSVLLQTDDQGNTVAKYDYGSDRLLSMVHANEGRQFYLFDGLGSVVNLMRPDGVVQTRYQYDAWGSLRTQTGGSANSFGFTGHERDDDTGLYYFKARYYDPQIGRFLTEDPYQGDIETPPSLHRYLYAYANPTVFVDPTGEVGFLTEGLNYVRESTISYWQNRFDDLDENTGLAETAAVGGLRGFAFLGETVAGALNAASNVIASNLSGEFAVGVRQDAQVELDGTIQAVSETIEAANNTAQIVVEDPGGTVTTVHAASVEYAVALAEGDRQAIAGLAGFLAESTALPPVVKGAAQVARQGTKAAVKGFEAAASEAAESAALARRLRSDNLVNRDNFVEIEELFRRDESTSVTGSTIDRLILGRGPKVRLEQLAQQQKGRLSTTSSISPREIFKQNFRDIRSADEIVQFMDNIPETLEEAIAKGGKGQFARAEKLIIDMRKDLLEKTTRIFEKPQ